MAFSTTMSGVVVGVAEGPYDFIDDQGKRVTGTTMTVALSQDFGAEPAVLRVPNDLGLRQRVADLQPYTLIEAKVSLFAVLRQAQAVLQATLSDFTVTPSPEAVKSGARS